jgi:hypothetical protein
VLSHHKPWEGTGSHKKRTGLKRRDPKAHTRGMHGPAKRLVASDSDATWATASHGAPLICADMAPMQMLLNLQAIVRRTLVSRWYSAMLIRFSKVLHKMQRLEVKSEVCKPSRLPSDYAETEDIVEFVQESLVHAQRRAQAIVREQAMAKEGSACVGDSVEESQPYPDVPHSIRQRMRQPKVVQTRVKNPTRMDVDSPAQLPIRPRSGLDIPESPLANRPCDVNEFRVASQGPGGEGCIHGSPDAKRPNESAGSEQLNIAADLRKSRGYIEAEGLARLGELEWSFANWSGCSQWLVFLTVCVRVRLSLCLCLCLCHFASSKTKGERIR